MNAKSIWLLLAGTLLLSACSLLSPPVGGLSLEATVGTEADVCADTPEINVFSDAPTTVYYCYTITNTGEVSVPLHDLSDDLFGVILSGFAYDLAPGASVDTVTAGVELAYEITEETVNTATWEGFSGPRRMASAEASTTVTPVPPLQYGAVAGTVMGGSNLTTIGAFSGNVVLLGVLDLAGDPIAETLDVTITAPGFAPFVYTYDPAETLDGVVALILDDFEVSTTVTPVPPLQYGAVAGTFVADGSFAPAYAANLVVLAIQTLEGEPVDAEVPVDITVPGFDTFTFLFDPATAMDGRVALIFGDGAVTPVSAPHFLGMPVETVTLARAAGLSTSAVVGGDFSFAFPGETLVRTVDAEAALVIPVVEGVEAGVDGDELSVTFTEDGGDGVAYLLEAYGRGPNGHAGVASGATSPIVVALNGPLGETEAYAIDVLAVRGAGVDPFVDDPMQLDVAEYLFASEED